MAHGLSTYLQDHLAGANMAVDLIEVLLRQEREGAVRDFLGGLLAEVAQDRDTLQKLAQDFGFGASTIKNVTAHLATQGLAIKLRAGAEQLGLFESFEFLGLGILGKIHLWKALEQIASDVVDLSGTDFGGLIRRAEAQYSAVEDQRLAMALQALGTE